ncbi:transporter [Flavobacterium sp.]|uniref:transporter n=1 Tax=Flavobacterium sp. TaxID=239 RepID=UPI002615B4DC|nr:transporter [Flavobacterium sp.]
MKIFKSIILLGFLCTSTANFGQFTDQINSNRPGESMGAFSVGKNVYQAEGGMYYIKESHSVLDYDAKGFGLDLSGRAGLFYEQLEFILDAKLQMDKFSTPYTDKNRSGLKKATLGAKYLFYDPFKKGEEKPNLYSWKANHRFKWKQFIPALSGYVGVNYVMDNDFSYPDEATVSPKVMVIAQNHFGARWVLVTNIIADKISSNASSFGYVMTLTRGINEKWSAFVENKGIKSDFYSDGIFTFGATHLLKNNIQLDASISTNIKNTPSLLYGGVGCSWRFDKKHKDIQIKDGKEVKDDKKAEDDKDPNKSKSQKELDKEMKKAEKKKKKEKTDEVDPEKQPEEKETPRKRLDEIEEEKPN